MATNHPPKVALVLSGGGSKGAFQFGAIQYIEENFKPAHPGFDYHIIAGISVGCLNGGMLAMNKYQDLKNLWNTMANDKVYSGSIDNFVEIAWRIIRGEKSALDNTPLKNAVHTFFTLNDFRADCDFRFGFVSLDSGTFSAVRASDFGDDENLRNTVLGSTTMPVIWEPVTSIRTKHGVMTNVVDGGVRDVSPLGDVIDGDPDFIVIINCSALAIAPDPAAAKNIFSIADRALTDITIGQLLDSDIEDFLTINDLVAQAAVHGVQLLRRDVGTMKHARTHRNGTPYKAYDYVLIQPDTDLGDSLDFSPPTVQSRIALGRSAAERQMKHFTFPGTEHA